MNQAPPTIARTLLMLMLLLTLTACYDPPRSHQRQSPQVVVNTTTQRQPEPWEREYRRNADLVIIERFEIDIRNTQALEQVGVFVGDQIVGPNGENRYTSGDLEVFTSRMELAGDLRRAPAQGTIRRTLQDTHVASRNGPSNYIRLPDASRRAFDAALQLPGTFDGNFDGNLPGDRQTRFALTRGGNYEEGMEMTLESTTLAYQGREGVRAATHTVPLFFVPGQSIVLRTNPQWPAENPAILRFDEHGQTYETVYLITYIRED